ncbi:MAG TPA: hypothetical protein VI320_36080 [Terracidiphilus sp.]
MIIQPNLDLPLLWLPLAVVALVTGLATILSHRNWPLLAAASVAGSLVGLFSGYLTLPLMDNIERAYSPIAIATGTLAAIPISICASLVSLVLRNLVVSNEKSRRVIWVVLVCSVAFGPMTLALTPLLVAFRVARNDRVAEKRFVSLKHVVEQTLTEADLILLSKVRMSEPFVAYPRTPTFFTEHVECQEAGSQYRLNSKGL